MYVYFERRAVCHIVWRDVLRTTFSAIAIRTSVQGPTKRRPAALGPLESNTEDYYPQTDLSEDYQGPRSFKLHWFVIRRRLLLGFLMFALFHIS